MVDPLSSFEQTPGAIREVVLGANAKVWRELAARPAIAAKFPIALGHKDLAGFKFSPMDRVWVFSYSRSDSENAALLAYLDRAKLAQIVYVSSSSVRVLEKTKCYEYPRSKHRAQSQALSYPNAVVLTLGLVYKHLDELPSGPSVATHYDDIASFMCAPSWSKASVWPMAPTARSVPLFTVIERPFTSGLERRAFSLYGFAITLSGAYPCLLRPLDLLLRTLGYKWYGYTFLSNRLWISTISS